MTDTMTEAYYRRRMNRCRAVYPVMPEMVLTEFPPESEVSVSIRKVRCNNAAKPYHEFCPSCERTLGIRGKENE